MQTLSDYDKMMNLNSLYEFFAYKAGVYAGNNVVQEYRDGRIFSHTYNELINDVKIFGNYLIQRGVHKKHVSIIGNFGYEWTISFFALLYANNVVVPIDGGLSNERIQGLLDFADVELVIAKQRKLSGGEDFKPEGKSVLYYDDVLKIIASDDYKEVSRVPDFQAPNPKSPAMIVFTSGTTGVSKGVLLSHGSILHNVIGTISIIGEYMFLSNANTIVLLPLFHMYCITAGILDVIYYGVSLCYSDNTIKDIDALLKTFKPVALVAVPQIVEGLHKKIWVTARRAGKQELLKKLIKVSRVLRKFRIDLRKIFFKQVLESFGKNFTIICGGAAANDVIVEELIEMGILVLVGYGITECAPIISVNPPLKEKLGSVGLPVSAPFCQIRIKDGEILVKGSIVMDGYYKNPQETKNVFDDGEWFKTGDLGSIDDDGYLYITGRIKNLIILSDGNNISPEELELRICQSPLIDSVVVFEEKRNQTPVLLASVYPDYQYCGANHIADIRGEALKLIEQVNAENPAYMKIYGVDIRDAPFEKTATGKIIRSAFINK